MAELSRNQLRNPGADRRQRRNSLIPDRRDTEAPVRRASNDIRSGTRGDVGGAEALMQLARQINGTANAFVERDNALFTKRQREDEAQGSLDAQSGTVDQEKMLKSMAYRESVTLGRAQRSWLEGINGLDDKIKEVLNNNTDPDPAVREAAVREVIEGHFQEFAIDPETGQLKDFGSPKAQRWLAEQMSTTRAKAVTEASAFIEAKINEEIITDRSEILRAKIRANEPVSIEDVFVDVPGTVDKASLKAAAVTVIKDEAAALQAQAIEEMATDPDKGIATYNRSRSLLLGLRTSTRNKDQNDIVPVDVPPSTSNAPAAPKQAPAPAAPKAPSGPAGLIASGLRSSGMPDVVIAGFLGNFEHESALGQNKASGDGGTAHGLAQWRFERVDNFRRVIGKHPKNATLQEQVRFVAWEMNNPEQAGMTVAQRNAILAAKTPAEAARLIDKYYERSNGKSREDRAKAAMKFHSGGFGDAGSDLPQIEGASDDVLNPPSVVAQLAKMAPAGNVGEFKGAYSLNPQERLELGQLVRQNDQIMNAAFDKARKEKQASNANEFLRRLSGVGNPTSASEIQQAMQRGDIDAGNGRQLLNIIETDLNQMDAEAKEALGEAEESEREAREKRVKTTVNDITGPVARGVMTVAAAQRKLLDIAAQETDPEVRQAIISAASTSLNGIANLRQKSPETKRAVGQLEEWKQTYITDLAKAVIPSGKRKQAEAEINSWINEWVMYLHDGNIAPESVPDFMKRAEEWLDNKVMTTYPPKKASKQ